MAASTPKKRMTVRVIASILAREAGAEWERINWFELARKEYTHNAALRFWVKKHKTGELSMTDENTVEAVGPALDNKGESKTVYTVLRYSNQCPECGAPATKPNAWCDLCMAQEPENDTFDAKSSLKALLEGADSADEEEDEEEGEEEEAA